MRVLLVKMSSMGDLVHTLPAITDAGRNGVEFDWVVEEAFTTIADRHPAVRNVLPIGWRRWRNDLMASHDELRQFLKVLRQQKYDLVLDSQGLWKSAVVARAARAGQRAGFDKDSAREGLSTLFNHLQVGVQRDAHAIDRQRQLFSGVFNYPLVNQPEEFGIEVEPGDTEPVCILAHGTTWISKLWPEPMWIELSHQLQAHGYQVLLPSGNEDEAQRANRIADASGAEVLSPLTLDQLIDKLANAKLIVGVDSGLSHLAAALGRPTITLYGATDPMLTGARGLRAVNLQPQFSCVPCRSRVCGYRGEVVRWQQQALEPACFSALTPDRVMNAVEAL